MVKIKEITPVESKGKWNFRRMTLTETVNDVVTEIAGIMWNTDKAVLEALDPLFASGGEVEYTITGQNDEGQNKFQVYPVQRDDEGKKVEKWGKSEEEKEFWKRREEREQAKFEYDIKRQSLNDKKIEWQTLAGLVQKFIQPDVESGAVTVEAAIDKLIMETNKLYKRVNGEEPQ